LETRNCFLVVVVRTVGGSRQRNVRGQTADSVPVLVDLHSQAQPHGTENFFDLVQRLPSEVFRLQHFGFGLLDQLANRLNVCILQAVVAAHRKLQLFDRTVQIFVLDLGLAVFRGGAGLDIFFEVDEDIHVVFQQLRRKADRVRGSNRAVGPDFERELVVIGDLSETRGLNRVIALAHRRVDRVDRNESDAEVFVEVLIGGDVAAAALQAHFHIELAAFADGRDVNVFVEHFDIAVGFNHAGGNNTRLIRTQIDRLRRVATQLEWDLLQVQDDVGRIFNHAGDRLELVKHAVNLDGGNSRAFDRAQQHAAKRIADGSAEAAFKRLRPEDTVLVS